MCISIPAVARDLQKNFDWVGDELKILQSQGRIVTQPLGVEVLHDGKSYPIEEVYVTIKWTEQDEKDTLTENQRIARCKDLLINAFETHDDLIVHKMGSGKAVASSTFRYRIATPSEVIEDDKILVLATAVAFIPGLTK